MIISEPNNQDDKFGFYQVDDLKFVSKFDAAYAASKKNLPIHWNFNESTFNLFNWEQEPVESLGELYRQRAQQLREKYDYLILWYSGGADSDNILDTFINNNIKLDEVASYVNYAADQNKFGFVNGEIFNLAVPKIEQIKATKQPWLEHTIIDICQLTVDYFQKPSAKFDWTYNINQFVNPNCTARGKILETHKPWLDLIDRGLKVGFIFGADKPSVTGLHGKYYFKFTDTIDGSVTTHQQNQSKNGQFYELFYWQPDVPKIPIKQGHVVKNFLKKLTENSQEASLTKSKLHSICSTTIGSKNYYIDLDTMHRLIYPTWYPRLYQVKPKSLLFTERDQWFFNLPDSDPAKYAWRLGLQHRWDSTPDFLKNDPANMAKGFCIFKSKQYYLGT